MGITRTLTSACSGLPLPCELWHRTPGSDGATYAVLYNPNAVGSGNASFGFQFADVGLAGITATVRDLWLHQDLGHFSGSYTTEADILPHEARALKITPQAEDAKRE